jgi:hypothetical protein
VINNLEAAKREHEPASEKGDLAARLARLREEIEGIESELRSPGRERG